MSVRRRLPVSSWPPSRLAGLAAAFLAGCLLLVPAHAAEPAKTASSKTTSNKKATSQKKTTKSTTPAKTPAKKPATSAAAQSDLDRVQQQIRTAENRIRLTREQREQKEAELKQTEAEIGELKDSMGSLQEKAGSHEERLQKLRAEKAERQAERDRLVNRIRADLRMAQRQGGEDHHKLLLNQQDPQTLARLMRYYGYLQKARGNRVQGLNDVLDRLDEISRQEEEELQRLQTLRTDLQKKQARLANAQQQRSKTIKVLNEQIESEDDKLKKLRRDQQALQAVVERLAREAAEREAQRRRQEQARAQQQAAEAEKGTGKPSKPAPPVDKPDYRLTPYSGRCPLPVSGGVRASFGSPRAGGLRWNGIVVAASAGTPVHAVLPGKVAFADYLRGYGFLVIVDHGRGLMSLYGQNQTLLKKAGDDVAGKEVIARVGDSGGVDADGLYFEIRMRGKPVDPANWCGYQ